MAVEIKWWVESVNYVIENGGIEAARWRCTARDGDLADSQFQLTEVPPFNVDSMIPYADVTEANVLDWVWSTDGVDKAQIEDSLKASVAEMTAPVRKTGTPWGP